MKKILLVCTGLLTLSAATAAAQIQVAWNDCLADGGAATRTSTCASNAGINRLIVSYTTPSPMSDFIAVDGAIDLQFDNGAIPQWWEFKNAGSCRETAAGIGVDVNILPNFGTSCADTWDGGNSATGLFTGYAPGFGGPNRARAVFSISRAASSPFPIAGGTTYFGWIWQISNANTLVCAGCLDPVALWAPEMTLRGVSGVGFSAAAAPIVLSGSPDDGTSCVSWNNGSCQATPTRTATWGSVKALYR